MANETTVVLEVTLSLNTDKMDTWEKEGCTDADIEALIEKSITIRNNDSKCPVFDVAEVQLVSYY